MPSERPNPSTEPGQNHEVHLIRGDVSFAGAVLSVPTVLRADSVDGASIVSFADASILAPVHIGVGIDLATCDFRGAMGLEQLHLSAACFARDGSQFLIASPTGSVCRQLRSAARNSGLHDLAADLHMTELDQARRQARRWSGRRLGLELYRVVGGYGHRPSRPLAVYGVMISLTTWLFHRFPDRFVGNDFFLGNNRVDYEHWPSVFFKLMLRVSLTPISPVDPTGMHTDGYGLLLGTKLATAMLLVFFGMGLRSRLRN